MAVYMQVGKKDSDVKLLFNLHAQNEATVCKGVGYSGYVFGTSYIVLNSIKEPHGRINLS